jgi:transposase-like protein
MRNSLLKIVKWFCSKLTFNELASAVVIFHEVLNNSRSDIRLKPDEKPPHYRQFRVDNLPPLPASTKGSKDLKHDWVELKQKYERETGKKINPVKRKNSKQPPIDCKCHCCGAPRKYLYLNNGTLASQVKCKICHRTSPTHSIKRVSKAKYLCPYCSYALFKWKDHKSYTIYKCPNDRCPHYLNNKSLLLKKEKQMRLEQKYNPNFKLRYQYREFHISQHDLLLARPIQNTTVDLTNIRNSYHVLGLVLTFTINLGLSSRLTRDALKGIFDISISHQTVLNYTNAAACFISPLIDANCPIPTATAAADETYIIVDNRWTYTWFIIDSKTKAICGYNLSQHRTAQPAIALLYNCYGKPGQNKPLADLVTDANPSYDAAVMAYNAAIADQDAKLSKRTVIGLKNLDKQSSEYRQFKQMIERLNRTYKYHTRPRAGFKSFDGATALTTLFVAFYNFMRPHSSLKYNPPVSIECLEKCRLMPEKWIALITRAAA